MSSIRDIIIERNSLRVVTIPDPTAEKAKEIVDRIELVLEHRVSLDKYSVLLEIQQVAFNHYILQTNEENLDKATLLLFATQKCFAQSVELLVNNEIVNVTDVLGQTALNRASQVNSVPIVRLLLQAGANPNIPCEKALTPLFWAINGRNHELVALLLEAGAEVGVTRFDNHNSYLHLAMQSKSFFIVQLLLDAAADVDATNVYHDTALLMATKRYSRVAVELLLAKGANSNAPTHYGETSLYISANRHQEDTAALLMQYNAEI